MISLHMCTVVKQYNTSYNLTIYTRVYPYNNVHNIVFNVTSSIFFRTRVRAPIGRRRINVICTRMMCAHAVILIFSPRTLSMLNERASFYRNNIISRGPHYNIWYGLIVFNNIATKYRSRTFFVNCSGNSSKRCRYNPSPPSTTVRLNGPCVEPQ